MLFCHIKKPATSTNTKNWFYTQEEGNEISNLWLSKFDKSIYHMEIY